MHRAAPQVADELSACIRCNECLNACPALAEPLPVEAVNRQTLAGPVAPEVARFAASCILCGACVPVCPVGLHRDAMMLWLKLRLLRGGAVVDDPLPRAAETGARIVALPPSAARAPALRPAPRHGPGAHDSGVHAARYPVYRRGR